MRRLALLTVVLGLTACRTDDVTSPKGGATFREVTTAPIALPAEALYGVCWPPDAISAQKVTLTFIDGDVVFEAKDGASNSTARCLREIAAAYPWTERPTGSIDVSPPAQPLDGWAVLAWVKLLSPARFGPERGLTDPAPLVSACVDAAGPARPKTGFIVRHTPGFEVRVLSGALAESERCIEAVLGSTAWPSSREVYFELPPGRGPQAQGDASLYVAPKVATGAALDPMTVKETVRMAGPAVSACWEEALARRAGLGGGRTFRFRVDDSGTVTHAWVTGNLSDGPVAADYLLDRCLAKALKALHFPLVGGDGVYTWVFATR